MEGKSELAEKRRLWQGRLEEWKASGLTLVEYCRLHNLDARNLQYWKKKILPKPRTTAALVEIPGILPRSLPGSQLCLVIDGRSRIEIAPGFDADTLGRLLGVFDRP